MTPAAELLLDKLKGLADPVRLRLVALCVRGECSVSELTEVLGQSQPRISQHLKTLCDTKLLQRFRDGHYVYYRAPVRGQHGTSLRQLLGLFAEDEPDFVRDLEKLRALRGEGMDQEPAAHDDRALHHALVELTVTDPLGDLIDIGCGQGRVLKLLASRAQRAVGVDIDADARRFARSQVLLAGLPNCTLRKGDMYALPFADKEFDTVILDDVLGDAQKPYDALVEARRLLRSDGRLLLLNSIDDDTEHALRTHFSAWCRAAELRMTAPKLIPLVEPRWLLAVATKANARSAAA
ncbi:MAG TPA: metalloregulator ArsR/SmtB family transcription factor [Woeseiaceae bacterium]|nr:metalloregulator ArsR/SmtB family transcription factor [Woeseiaceae bacterium]